MSSIKDKSSKPEGEIRTRYSLLVTRYLSLIEQ